LNIFLENNTDFRYDIVDIIGILLLDTSMHLYPQETREMRFAKRIPLRRFSRNIFPEMIIAKSPPRRLSRNSPWRFSRNSPWCLLWNLKRTTPTVNLARRLSRHPPRCFSRNLKPN